MKIKENVTFTLIFNITMKWLRMFESGSNLIGFHMEKVEF